VADAGDQLEAVEQADAGELDGLGDVGDVCDAELVDHGAADVVFGVGDELVEEDVVVDGVADDGADDADGEREGGDGRDQVVRADDGRDDGGRDDDAADAEAREDEQAPELVEVVDVCYGERSAACDVVIVSSRCSGWGGLGRKACRRS